LKHGQTWIKQFATPYNDGHRHTNDNIFIKFYMDYKVYKHIKYEL